MKLTKLLTLLIIAFAAISCGREERVIVHEPKPMSAPEPPRISGVDTFPELVAAYLKTSKSGDELQKKLNTEGAHNLDINEDGFTDTLRVVEHQSEGMFKTERSFVIQSCVSYEPATWQDVLTIDLSQSSNNMQITGNPLFYGNNYYFVPSYSVPYSTLAFVAWCYSPRPVFVTNFDVYSYRSRYRVVPRSQFRTRTATVRTVRYTKPTTRVVNNTTYKPSNVSSVQSKVTKRNQDYQSKKKRFEQRQKSFKKQDPSKKVGTGLAGKDYKSTSGKDKAVKPSTNPNAPKRAGPNDRQKQFKKQDPNKKVGKGLAPKSKPRVKPKPKKKSWSSKSSRRSSSRSSSRRR